VGIRNEANFKMKQQPKPPQPPAPPPPPPQALVAN